MTWYAKSQPQLKRQIVLSVSRSLLQAPIQRSYVAVAFESGLLSEPLQASRWPRLKQLSLRLAILPPLMLQQESMEPLIQ
jgi:hypothetical protein